MHLQVRVHSHNMCFTTTTKNNNINIGTTTRTTCHAHWTDQDGVQQQQQQQQKQQQQQRHQQQQQQLPIFYIPAMLCEAIRMTLPSVVPNQLVQLEVLLLSYNFVIILKVKVLTKSILNTLKNLSFISAHHFRALKLKTKGSIAKSLKRCLKNHEKGMKDHEQCTKRPWTYKS